MQVIILCGGLGTRLREETEFRPKPMVPLGARPILWHIMKFYAHHGVTDFLLALGYKGDMIKDYFLRYEVMNNDVTIELGRPESLLIHQGHDEAGWRITLADTGQTALKGARLKRVERYLTGDTVMVTYGDGVSDVDLGELIAFHRGHGRMATVTGVNPTARFGELRAAGDQVVSFREKQANTGTWVSGGFFVFERSFFGLLEDDDGCDLESRALERLARDGELMVYRHTGFWACMDTVRDRDYLNDLWHEGRAPWKVW